MGRLPCVVFAFTQQRRKLAWLLSYCCETLCAPIALLSYTNNTACGRGPVWLKIRLPKRREEHRVGLPRCCSPRGTAATFRCSIMTRDSVVGYSRRPGTRHGKSVCAASLAWYLHSPNKDENYGATEEPRDSMTSKWDSVIEQLFLVSRH